MYDAVIVAGDREWFSYLTLATTLPGYLSPGAVLINGDCRGADRQAKEFGLDHNYRVETYPADWNRLGRSAGPKRNQQMLDRLLVYRDKGYPVGLILYHDWPDLRESRGTAHMRRIARNADVPVTQIQSPFGTVIETYLAQIDQATTREDLVPVGEQLRELADTEVKEKQAQYRKLLNLARTKYRSL